MSRAEKLVVGCYPSKVDSIATWMVELQDVAQMYPRLSLRSAATDGTQQYYYISRLFETVEGVMPGEFIPLVFFGSMWYDEKYGVYRFCGEQEIAPDLSEQNCESCAAFLCDGCNILSDTGTVNVTNNKTI